MPAEDRITRQGPEPGRPDLWVGLAESVAGDSDHRPRNAKTAETVALAIVRDIVAGDMVTGDRLPSESAMLAQYHVSRASLREGLRLLEVQGLITIRTGPGGGPAVGTVDPRNLARLSTLYLNLGGATYGELFRAHLVFEPLVADMAAQNPDRRLVRDSLSPFLAPELPLAGDEYRDVTTNFHANVQALVDNRVVELFTRVVGHIVLEHVITRMDSSGLRESIHEDHREIAAAIIAGQPTKARRLMSAHFECLWEHYQSQWPDRFDEFIEWS